MKDNPLPLPIRTASKFHHRVTKVSKLALKTNLLCGIFFIVLLWLLSRPIAGLFVDASETTVLDMASRGAILTSLAFLFNGFNIFAASYFTAIDRPDLSLLIAALLGRVFLIPLILLLPGNWGIDGIWLSTPIAELATAAVAMVLLHRELSHNHSNMEK